MTAVQPEVTWIVSWMGTVKRYGYFAIQDGEPGSAYFDTQAEAEADKAEREARGYRCELWTMQGVG